MHKAFKKRFKDIPVVPYMKDLVVDRLDTQQRETADLIFDKMYEKEGNLFISTSLTSLDIIIPFVRSVEVSGGTVAVFGTGTADMANTLFRSGFRNVFDVNNYQLPSENFYEDFEWSTRESFKDLFETGQLKPSVLDQIDVFVVDRADHLSNAFLKHILKVAEEFHIQVIAIGSTLAKNCFFDKSLFSVHYYKSQEAVDDAINILKENGYYGRVSISIGEGNDE